MRKIQIENLIKNNFTPPQIYTYPPRGTLKYQNVYNEINDLWQECDLSDGLGIYFHIPFWKYKCIFCNLYAFEYNEQAIVDRYIDAVCGHMKMHLEILKQVKISTIHFGGGDPLLIGTSYLKRIINLLNDELPTMDLSNIELSVETTPFSVIQAEENNEIQELKSIGVNRINIGAPPLMYSSEGDIHRVYGESLTYKAIALLKKYRFHNISVDLMLGIENETINDWINTVEIVCRLQPDTISYLPLTVRSDSLFGKDQGISIRTSKKYYEWYDKGVKILLNAGYHQENATRFALDSGGNLQEDNHFSLKPILGLGAGARSYSSRRDYVINPGDNGLRSVEKYIKAINEGTLMNYVYYSAVFSNDELFRKKLILNCYGIHKREFFDTENKYQLVKTIKRLVDKGFCYENDNVYFYSFLGLKYHDLICLQFYSDKSRDADPALWASVEEAERINIY